MTRLIDADLLRKNMEFICMSIMAGTDPYNAPLTEIDNAPTVEPKLSNEQIEKITDLLETEWGYEGIREDVSRILRGDEE